MSNSLLYSMSDEFDKTVINLKMTADRAAGFFIRDGIIRSQYLFEIDSSISNYQSEFEKEKNNPIQQGKVLDRIKKELDLTNKEYQLLRMRDYVTYIITDVFEEHGVIKYGKIAMGVTSSATQIVAGFSLMTVGKRLNSKTFQGAGVMLISHGGNNMYETVSPLIYEHAHAGILRKIYRSAASAMGFEQDKGDFAYSAVDFSLQAYAAIKSPILQGSSKRLIKQSLIEKSLEKPGTGKLFHAVSSDYAQKWSLKSKPMKLYFIGDTFRKAVMEFPLDGYDKIDLE